MFDWREFLHLARNLAQAPDEASQRSAISRSYYAMYNEAKRYVSRRLNVPRHGEGHAMVWSALKQSSTRAERAAGIHGDRLKYKRTQADYEVYANLRLPHDAQQALETAETTIRSLRHLAGEQG